MAAGLRPVAAAAARGFAFFAGVFTLTSLLGRLRTPAVDATVWWIDLRPLPGVLATALLVTAATLLLAYALQPTVGGRRRAATTLAAVGLALAALLNVVQFYAVWSRGEIDPHVPVPLSLPVAVCLGLLGWSASHIRAAPPAQRSPARPCGSLSTIALIAAFVVLLGVLFPLAQVFFFGTTDYRRPTDAAVVFGAQVHDDGVVSTTLHDRVATAVGLYREGLVRRIVMSGGQGTAPVHEVDAMRGVAVELGVPESAILVDREGVDTGATVENTSALFRRAGVGRVLAVSHFYHLARVKLAYQGQGVEVFTVPAEQSVVVPQTPRLVLREVPAFWLYYLRTVAG
jgi:vancomycin permeability regulator SanA